jgi:putative CocE/NonD family hydrolase
MRIESTFCRTTILLRVAMGTFVLSACAVFGQQSTFEIVSRRNVMVPMRDGVKLATDVHRPAKNGTAVEGRFPVVLSRRPYGKASSMAGCDQRIYVPSGYVVVRQDTRGRGGSEGIWHWMTDARQDGYDTIEWIARQPWSNGKIGMVGCSYVGATQHLAALGRPPHLTTIMPVDSSRSNGQRASSNACKLWRGHRLQRRIHGGEYLDTDSR